MIAYAAAQVGAEKKSRQKTAITVHGAFRYWVIGPKWLSPWKNSRP